GRRVVEGRGRLLAGEVRKLVQTLGQRGFAIRLDREDSERPWSKRLLRLEVDCRRFAPLPCWQGTLLKFFEDGGTANSAKARNVHDRAARAIGAISDPVLRPDGHERRRKPRGEHLKPVRRRAWPRQDLLPEAKRSPGHRGQARCRAGIAEAARDRPEARGGNLILAAVSLGEGSEV